MRIGVVPALVIAVGVAAAGWLVGQGMERFRMADRSVTVKGLAELDVKSDFAIWTLGFRRAGNEFGAVQRQLSADRDRVHGFLLEQGFTVDEIELRPLQVQDLLAREWGTRDVALRFTGQGQVVVKSARVEAVTLAANRVDPLIEAGVQLFAENEGMSGPRYQLRGFNELKPRLLEEATLNAHDQAQVRRRRGSHPRHAQERQSGRDPGARRRRQRHGHLAHPGQAAAGGEHLRVRARLAARTLRCEERPCRRDGSYRPGGRSPTGVVLIAGIVGAHPCAR